MALLNEHSDFNKVHDVLPATRRVRTQVRISETAIVIQDEVIDTESFRFTGMTKTAAAACQAAMIELYTELVSRPVVANGAIAYTSGFECVANIKASRVGGRMWEVSVELNRITATWNLGAS